MLAGKDESGPVILEAASEITGCLLFWWAEVVVMNSIPTLKDCKVLTLYAHQWIKVLVQNQWIGYYCSFVKTWLNAPLAKKYVVYVAIGIKRSIIFILSALLLLLTWSLYFGKHLNTSQNKRILVFGTKTLVSVLVCSFLWLIKSSVLLYWEAHAVYDRLQSKITYISKQLYFLVLLSHGQFLTVGEQSRDDGNRSLCCAFIPSKKKSLWVLLYSDSEVEGEGSQIFNRKNVRDTLINRTGSDASIYDIQQAGKQFLTAQYALSKESNPGDIQYLQGRVSEENRMNVTRLLRSIIRGAGEAYSEVQNGWEYYSNIIQGEDYWEDDWKILRHLLMHTGEEISFQKVKTWMERAHNRCMFLANTLISEKEVVRCLNQVISWLIIGATLIMWLLLTGLASTNVLILLASPLLAATFIFGDTCKSLFQGLMFVYVAHPFHVGDLCVIDEKMLEVKRIGVWSTTFSKVRTVGNQEDVIYPNSELITKNLINHKTEFDWKDYVEFTPSSSDKKITEDVIREIEKYLDTEKERFTPNFHSVEFLETGDSDKIGVHFKHCAKTEGWTYFECLKEKEKRRVEFTFYVRNLMSQQSIT